MKPLVFDATPLIYLTKIGRIELILDTPARKFASKSVFREVVERGMAKGLPDALVLGRLFEEKQISMLEPSDARLLRELGKIRGLGDGDAETLTIAKEKQYRAVIDDQQARRVAKTYGVDFVGTPYILFTAISQGRITRDSAQVTVDDMIMAGWRCGPELYREITRIIRTM
jgi:predicted nucleic acid-binding protein